MEDGDTAADVDEIVYHVDPEGRITYVNSRWDAFALENDGAEVIAARVLGKPLAGFIADMDTRHLIGLMMRHVFKTGRTVTAPFRCDAPVFRRRMQLTIEPGPSGVVVFRSRLLAAEARPALHVLDRRAPREPETLLRLCSWCNRGRLGDRWAELEEVIEACGLFDVAAVPRITHGLCVDCEKAVIASWLEGDTINDLR